jgi:RNase P/RNase MRP subunit POP5
VKYANPRTGLIVLRCGRGECATVWASATLTTHVRGRAAMLRLLHQGGAVPAASACAVVCVWCAHARALTAAVLRVCARIWSGTLRSCQQAALAHSEAALQALLPRMGEAGVAAARATAEQALAAMEP